MHLCDFIERDMEAILSLWERFARSLPMGASMDAASLRDHAEEILRAACQDLRSAQTGEQQDAKSRGLAPAMDARETAAQTHAFLRARGGFAITQMVSEYRALRASVMRLWAAACAPDACDLAQTIRFNEAIDQAVAESVTCFSMEVDRARDLLLGALGHDMRNPLNAIVLSAEILGTLNAGEAVSAVAGHLIKSGGRMKSLIDDLTDFNRTRLGLGIAIAPKGTDLREVFEDEMSILRAAHPGLQVSLDMEGDLHGDWDADRLHQVLGNLVQNAFRHGSPDRPITVRLVGSGDEVSFEVVNEGQISSAELAVMFEPLTRGSDQPPDERGLGLGLYICRAITEAHGGSIAARSSSAGTAFTVRLPRHAARTGS